MLKFSYSNKCIEAGCDEAGRGCLAGPVFAAAVILSPDFRNELLTDSKKLSEKQRNLLRPLIEEKAWSWAVAAVDNHEIDEINILNASFLAMHRALDKLHITPELILVDGNRFKVYGKIPHQCIIGGDAKYMSIAAASVLAKTHRDEYMKKIDCEYPSYLWKQNKGYPTPAHRRAVITHGPSQYHRLTFNLAMQLKIGF
jgi:ribonuclease HII